MAHFYGWLEGSAQRRITRCGNKNSGVISHVSSWDKGIKISCEYNNELNKNVFKVYTTGGSLRPNNTELVFETEEILPPKPKRIRRIKKIANWSNNDIDIEIINNYRKRLRS